MGRCAVRDTRPLLALPRCKSMRESAARAADKTKPGAKGKAKARAFAKAKARGGGENARDWWGITLGDAQYRWFKRTLEGSKAKYKFVFTHHVLGTGRGATELADLYEWGGKDRAGQWEFDRKRPGWELPIHQLMVKYGVTIFFQGHDHLFAHQRRDGVVYQEAPNPDRQYLHDIQSGCVPLGRHPAQLGLPESHCFRRRREGRLRPRLGCRKTKRPSTKTAKLPSPTRSRRNCKGAVRPRDGSPGQVLRQVKDHRCEIPSTPETCSASDCCWLVRSTPEARPTSP